MKNLTFTVIFILCCSTIAWSQSYNSTTGVLTIDLAQSQQKLKIKVTPKKDLKIRIENMLPFTKYTLIADITAERIPPFDSDEIAKLAGIRESKDSLAKDLCTKEQIALIEKIYNSSTEKELAENRRELQKKIHDCGGENAISDLHIRQHLALIQALTQSEFSLSKLGLGSQEFLVVGEKITLTIIREATPGLSITKEDFKPFEISGGSKGTWETNYGFSFNTTAFGKNKEYYSKADTGSTYLITEKGSKLGLGNVYPTVFLTYYPQSKYLSPFFVGFTSGLGSNLDDISVFVAPSLVIEQNVLISCGISLTKSLALKGEYNVNQRIKENLNSDQLHSNTYRPNLFFSISYRFNKNPFKKAGDE